MTDTTSSESPTTLDVFEEALMILDPKHFDSDVIVQPPFPGHMDEYDERQAYESAHTLPELSEAIEDGDPNDWPRCFVGNAVVVAPRLTGRHLRFSSAFGPGYADIADHYHVREQLVYHIGEGVVGKSFRAAKRFAQACILAERMALAEGKYPRYPYARDFHDND